MWLICKYNLPFPPILTSSAGGGKRTLKRRGQSTLAVGTSASTSKLLKSLSTYRPSTKTKALPVMNAGNLHKTTALHQTTTNAPSYMAATTASSRKLNFVQTTADYSSNKSNLTTMHVIKSRLTVSPKQGGILGGTSTSKENDEPKVHLLSRPKDSTG